MNKRLVGKYVLVTGSTRGLGHGIALALVKAGVEGIGIHGRRREDCQRVVEEIAAMGTDAIAVPGDISKSGDIERVLGETLDRFGRLDILVNNAGGALRPGGPFWTRTAEQFAYELSVNFSHVFFFSKLAALQMIEQGGGRIINISSGGAHLAHGNASIYNSGKAAVEHFTRCAAVELGTYNVLVNCIAPGSVAKHEGALAKNDGRTAVAKFMIPMGRIGFPHEVGDLVVFFASEESKYITGQIVTIDGGRECQLPRMVPVVLDDEGMIQEIIPPAEVRDRLVTERE